MCVCVGGGGGLNLSLCTPNNADSHLVHIPGTEKGPEIEIEKDAVANRQPSVRGQPLAHKRPSLTQATKSPRPPNPDALLSVKVDAVNVDRVVLCPSREAVLAVGKVGVGP